MATVSPYLSYSPTMTRPERDFNIANIFKEEEVLDVKQTKYGHKITTKNGTYKLKKKTKGEDKISRFLDIFKKKKQAPLGTYGCYDVHGTNPNTGNTNEDTYEDDIYEPFDDVDDIYEPSSSVPSEDYPEYDISYESNERKKVVNVSYKAPTASPPPPPRSNTKPIVKKHPNYQNVWIPRRAHSEDQLYRDPIDGIGDVLSEEILERWNAEEIDSALKSPKYANSLDDLRIDCHDLRRRSSSNLNSLDIEECHDAQSTSDSDGQHGVTSAREERILCLYQKIKSNSSSSLVEKEGVTDASNDIERVTEEVSEQCCLSNAVDTAAQDVTTQINSLSYDPGHHIEHYAESNHSSPGISRRESHFQQLYAKINSAGKVPYEDLFVVESQEGGMSLEEMFESVLESEGSCSSDVNSYEDVYHGYG